MMLENYLDKKLNHNQSAPLELTPSDLKIFLEDLYLKFNKRKYVPPDPLQFLYKFNDEHDIEVVGLISSSFAYGRVNNILNFLDKLLKLLKNPYEFLINADRKFIHNLVKDLKYRFTDSLEISEFLLALGEILRKYKSLYNLFSSYYSKKRDIVFASKMFIKDFYKISNGKIKTLLPDYRKNSAFKRFFLFLRWMIRKDDVDLGIWQGISPERLIVPLDTHMFRIAKMLNFTKRKVSDLKTAIEITENFKLISPEDPVKYDFVLTRFGINPKFSNIN